MTIFLAGLYVGFRHCNCSMACMRARRTKGPQERPWSPPLSVFASALPPTFPSVKSPTVASILTPRVLAMAITIAQSLGRRDSIEDLEAGGGTVRVRRHYLIKLLHKPSMAVRARHIFSCKIYWLSTGIAPMAASVTRHPYSLLALALISLDPSSSAPDVFSYPLSGMHLKGKEQERIISLSSIKIKGSSKLKNNKASTKHYNT
nr:hypothetical protein Iba_chr05eCG13840 [Ipomoea batatas]